LTLPVARISSTDELIQELSAALYGGCPRILASHSVVRSPTFYTLKSTRRSWYWPVW